MNITALTRFVVGSAALIGVTLGMAGIFMNSHPTLAQEKTDGDLPPRFLYDGAVWPEETRNLRWSVAPVLSKRKDSKEVLEQFVGNWRLVSFESFGQNGEVTRRDMVGRIMYDKDGNMAAQLMPTNSRQEPENGRVPGYVAYFGTYEVDVDEGTVTHLPEGAVFTRWVSGELLRYFEFRDERLLLSLKNDGRVTGTLTWERVHNEKSKTDN